MRRLRDLFSGTRTAARDTRRSNLLRLETLEGRLMLAGDLLSDYCLPSDGQSDAGTDAPLTASVLSSMSAAEGEGAVADDLVAFAKALAAQGEVKYFGAAWCPACTAQKELFEDGGQFLPFIEVSNPDRTRNETGIAENITSYPTWEFPDGSRETGMLSLETISARSGVAIPTSANPFIAPIADTIVLDGSPLHVGLDGYDPNGGLLTYVVTSSNPAIVQPTLLSGNLSASIRFIGWGEMVVQLFQQRAPDAAGRFIELAEAQFYDAVKNNPDVTAHRVKDDFMLQFGDPTGTGAGGSSLGDFDDDFHPDLQHNTPGIFSWAKSNDDTSDSQVFVIDVPTRHLDFNHSVFGMLTEGDKVRDEMTKTATDDDWRPLVPMNIQSVSIFQDTENGVVMLKAVEGATGTATITVTVTDAQNNSYVETFDVTVQADPYDGGPYLDDIDPVSTTVDVPAVFQLSAIDVEGDTVVYGGVKTGTIDYMVEVDAQTGVATVTPPAGYIGTMDVLVYTRQLTTSNTSDTFDTQIVTVTVTPDAPQAVDLLAGSDSGTSDSDDVTNVTNMEFLVNGVTDGALVRLYLSSTGIGFNQQGTTVIEQATASGTSVTFTTASLAGLGDGTHSLFATQTIDGIESPATPALDVTYDGTVPPAFTSTPPTSAAAHELLSYDVGNPEEGTAGTLYSLVNAPAGVNLNATSGQLSWTPGTNDIGTHQFAVVMTDLAGNTRTQDLNIEVSSVALVGFRLEITDRSGTPLSSLAVGGEFDVRVYVTDVSSTPHGVYAAFIDLLYDQQLVAVDGVLTYGASYPNNHVGNTSTPGIVDEVGAVSGIAELGGSEYFLFRLPMQAIHAGTALFESDPADNLPFHELLRYGGDFDVQFDEVIFGSTTLVIDPAFGAIDDIVSVDEDSGTTELDVLGNDQAFEGSSGVFTIVGVTATNHGGSAVITTDGTAIEYTPADNFFGQETFTYTVSDGTGTDTATVTVNVTPRNDNPTANDDTAVVMEDSVNFVIDVLGNDTIAPDVSETLVITSHSAPSAGGSLTIAPNGDKLLYTPTGNFFGTETFSYVISDGNGGTATATVEVTVAEQNDPPTATNDLFNAVEDSVDNTLNVLTNDNTAGDADETITIVEVSDPDQGGSVVIASDNLSLIYTPAADFFGTERFTYRITDGNGGYAEATVTMRVAGSNDPPVAHDDSFTVVKGTSDSVLAVLDNDDSGPDTPEVLKVLSVQTMSAGGTATVASDGLSILYTPAANFTGSETFTYTIEDPAGATAQATVTVLVLEYIPSSISGTVYLDVNNDGLKSATETPLGGVILTLVGTDMFGDPVELQQTTDALGRYRFLDLAPGSYEVVETQPQFLIDGIDLGGGPNFVKFYPAGTDSLPIELEQDSHFDSFNFGERGRTANQITSTYFFASRPRESVLIAASSNGGGQWYAVEGGWAHAQSMSVGLEADMSHAQLDVVTTDSQQYSTTLNLTQRSQVHFLAAAGYDHLFRVVGAPQLLFPDADCACATGDEEAEGESTVLAASSNDAEGEAVLAAISPAAALQLDAQLIVNPVLNRTTVNHLTPTLPLTNLPVGSLEAEGEGNDTIVLMPATPADAHLANDLLLAEPIALGTSSQIIEQLFASAADTDDEFALAVDYLMEQPLVADL